MYDISPYPACDHGDRVIADPEVPREHAGILGGPDGPDLL